MTRERYNPLHDPEAQECPAGCGWLTDDPYGGPCWCCWNELNLGGEVDDAPPALAFRRCDEDCMDVGLPLRPVVTVYPAGGLL